MANALDDNGCLSVFSSPWDLIAEINRLEAERDQLRTELAEFQRIRELLIKSLMRATDYGRERIEEGPLTAAVAHAKSVAECREALHVIKAIVCGEAMPRWENTPRTGVSRSRIADICDAALAADGENNDGNA